MGYPRQLDEIQPKKLWVMADYGLWQLWVKTALSVVLWDLRA
jgi:hypothetical protein